MKLLRTQKNQVFQLIQNAGLNPQDFFWDDETVDYRGGRTGDTTLLLRGSEYFYEFGTHRGSLGEREFHARYSPGDASLFETADVYDWSTHVRLIPYWLACLRREHESPDYWRDLQEASSVFGNAFGAGNETERFSQQERESIVGKLDQIKAECLANQRLFSSHAVLVEREFSYLKEKLDSPAINRKDWKLLLIGTVLNIAWEVGKTPQLREACFGFFRDLFARLFQAVLPG